MDAKRAKPAGIKEIARQLGISIGTVDRALHHRSGVNAETQARVLAKAADLNYQPNLAARNLKLNRRLRIAVHVPEQIASFFQPLREGIRAAIATLPHVKLDVDFRSYPRLGEGDVALLEQELTQQADGLLMVPGNPSAVEGLIRKFAARGTAVLCVASDAPRSERTASVCVDATTSGALAAELLAKLVRTEAPVAIITGQLSTFDHGEKLRGFAGMLATVAPHLTLLPVLETHERAEDAYQATRTLLARKTPPAGLYVSTANSLSVLRAVEECGLLGKIEIVTTDLFTELVPYLEAGKVTATIYQRPFTQGKVALEALVRSLLDGVRPEPCQRLAPHIILRSNLHLFLPRMESVTESADEAANEAADEAAEAVRHARKGRRTSR